MEFILKIKKSRKLSTKGCCFLCLQSENINETKDPKNNQDMKSISIRSLLLHLQITDQFLKGRSIFGEDFRKEDILVDLCENCGLAINRFSVLFQKLEKIQLETNYLLERIHKGISQSAKDPDRVQNYSKRMTSDLEALSQLAFVDNLRKQVAKESLKKLNLPRLQLILTRASNKLIKTENNEEICEINCGDYLGNYFTDGISPAPSPNSTANNEEDIKSHTINSTSFSAATLTKNEKLSPSLKPPVKQKLKRGGYYTKNLSTGLYECKKCDKNSKRPQTIAVHFKSVHLKIRYKCDICNVSVFKQLDKVSRHKKICRQNLEKNMAKNRDPKFKFICKICGKRWSTKAKLLQHLSDVHKNIGRYPCDLCDKKFKKSDHLKYHRDAVHLGIKFNCGFCSKSFGRKYLVKIHEMNCAKKSTLKKEPE